MGSDDQAGVIVTFTKPLSQVSQNRSVQLPPEIFRNGMTSNAPASLITPPLLTSRALRACFAGRTARERSRTIPTVDVVIEKPEPAAVSPIRDLRATDTRIVEAAEDGWWYSAWLPGSVLVVAFMTDADLVPHTRAHAIEQWWRRVERARRPSEVTPRH